MCFPPISGYLDAILSGLHGVPRALPSTGSLSVSDKMFSWGSFLSLRCKDGKMRLAWRLVISAGLIVALLAGCSRLPHIDHATVALLMVLAIVGLATMWGRAEALTGAIIGGLAFDYYFLPPRGFGIAAPEHWVALVAFLVTGVVTSEFAARSRRDRIEAVNREIATEKLYKLVNALLESGSAESTLQQLADALVKSSEPKASRSTIGTRGRSPVPAPAPLPSPTRRSMRRRPRASRSRMRPQRFPWLLCGTVVS